MSLCGFGPRTLDTAVTTEIVIKEEFRAPIEGEKHFVGLVFVLVLPVFTAFSRRRSFLLLSLLTGTASTLESRHQRASVLLASFCRGGVGCGWCVLARTFSQSPCRPRFDRCFQRRSSWCDFCYRTGMAAWFMPYALPIGAVIGSRRYCYISLLFWSV